jgi:hypothetical protein
MRAGSSHSVSRAELTAWTDVTGCRKRLYSVCRPPGEFSTGPAFFRPQQSSSRYHFDGHLVVSCCVLAVDELATSTSKHKPFP